MRKFDFFLDIFINFELTNSGDEVYEIQWKYLICVFLFIWFFFPVRFFASFFILLLIEPQTPLWNPLITRIRHLFLTYEIAKKSLANITWGAIGIFYFIHFRY